MHSIKLLVALGAVLASAKSCEKEIEITEVNQVFDCDVAEKDVTVSEDLAGELRIDGLKRIKGNLIINNASQILSISSTTIESIEKRFQLQNLRDLNRLELSSLRTLNDIDMITLPQLRTLTFGSNGVTKASSIRISDTRLNDLSGLKLANVDTFSVDNNRELKSFNSDLVKVNAALVFSNNGKDMEITMEKLESAGEIELSSVKSFSAPALEKAKSIKMNKNEELTKFKAGNLTTVDNSITFIDNKKLSQVSFPELTTIGDMTIQNNTKLGEVAGFPKLERVKGGVILRGDFEKVELPKLAEVNGGVTVTSTTDISDFCEFFDGAKKDDKIEGDESCSWNNPEANTETGEDSKQSGDRGGDGSSNGSGSGNSEEDDDSAVGNVRASMAMLGLAVLAGVAQLL